MATSKTKKSDNIWLRKDLVIGTLFAELLGTFFLTAAVLATSGAGVSIIVYALVALIAVLIFGRISGGHFNPAITLALLSAKHMSLVRAAGYLVAQFIGAMLAFIAVTKFMEGATSMYGTPPEVFKMTELTQTWRPYFAELLGALIVGFGVGAVFLSKKEGFDAAFTIGGSLLGGLLIATVGTSGLLNPALAVGASAFNMGNLWTLWVYALAPIMGVAAGFWVYKLLLWDVEQGGIKLPGKK